MEKALAAAEELTVTVREYVQNGMDSVQLRVAERGSAWIAQSVVILLVSVVLFLAAGFIGVTLALLVGMWTGHLWAGFLVVALLYTSIAGLLWLRREKGIRLPLVNYFIQQFTSVHEKDQ